MQAAENQTEQPQATAEPSAAQPTALEMSKAARVYTAFALEAKARGGPDMPLFTKLPDKGRAWFAVVNAIDQYLEPPDAKEPYEYELTVPIPQRRISDEFVYAQGDAKGQAPATDAIVPEQLPTSLKIRPLVAGDLCCPGVTGSTDWDLAIRARVHDVDRTMLEWRIDAADAEAADMLLGDAAGPSAVRLMRRTYKEHDGENWGNEPWLDGAWEAAAFELFTEQKDDRVMVRCRTPGLGPVVMGPLRVGHIRVQEDAADKGTEWDGWIEAISAAVNRSSEELRAARTEDIFRLQRCFIALKKKVEMRALSLFVARRSSTSTAGDQQTSTSSPSGGSI